MACQCLCHDKLGSVPCRVCSCWSYPINELREIVRLRLATDEGSLRVRADRMWEIAEAALAKAAGESK